MTVNYTRENCEALAHHIVNHMDVKDLIRIVFEDLDADLSCDRDLFDLNCEQYDWKPE